MVGAVRRTLAESERAIPILALRQNPECDGFSCHRSVHFDSVQGPVKRRIAAEEEGAEPPFRYVFHHLPLRQRHPHAVHAGVAAEAAARQGAFWDVHEQLFAHQDQLEDEDLQTYAAAIGLDLDRFEEDLHDESLHDRVVADRSSAVDSGVRRTSNLFIGGKRYRGTFEPDALLRAIRRRAAAERTSDAQNADLHVADA